VYLTSGWNFLELPTYLLSFGTMILRFVVLYQINRLTLDATTVKFVDLQYIKTLEDFENYFFAGMTLIYWGRLLKYARVWPRVGLLVKIAGSMLIDVGIFLIMFFVFVAGFSLVFHITMGYANADFRDWEQSLLSSWRMIWGDWDYSEFQAVRVGWTNVLLFVSSLLWCVDAELSHCFVEQEVLRSSRQSKRWSDSRLGKSCSDLCN